MIRKNKNGGFIQITLIIIGALVILKYAYDVDIIEFLTTGKFRDFLDMVYNFGSKGWEKYSEIIMRVWNFTLNTLKDLLDKIKN